MKECLNTTRPNSWTLPGALETCDDTMFWLPNTEVQYYKTLTQTRMTQWTYPPHDDVHKEMRDSRVTLWNLWTVKPCSLRHLLKSSRNFPPCFRLSLSLHLSHLRTAGCNLWVSQSCERGRTAGFWCVTQGCQSNECTPPKQHLCSYLHMAS